MALDFSVKNGDIFPILDAPVIENSNFDKSLTNPLKAPGIRDNRPNKGEIILNVAHGRNLDELKRWIDVVSSVQLDGWGLGSFHRNSTNEILKHIFYMTDPLRYSRQR